MNAVLTTDRRFENNMSLLRAAHEGDTGAEEELLRLNMGLVRSIAQRFCGRGVDLEDLIQIGTIGLLKAIRSFDPDRGFAFSTYAVPLVIGEIKRSLRDDGLIKVGRQQKKLGFDLLAARSAVVNAEGREPPISELAAACSVSTEEAAIALDAISPVSSLSEPSDGGDGSLTLESRIADPDDAMERLRDRVALGQALARLDPFSRRIVVLRYYMGMTQQKTAEELGVTQVKVSREEKKILAALRRELA